MERFLNYQNEQLAADKEVACHSIKVEATKLCSPVVKIRLLLMIPPISTYFLILHTFSDLVTSSIIPDRCVCYIRHLCDFILVEFGRVVCLQYLLFWKGL